MPQPELFSAEKKEVRGGHCFTTVGSQLWHSLDIFGYAFELPSGKLT
jgi:hypothetical protein